jgi:DNA topoisomerase-1
LQLGENDDEIKPKRISLGRKTDPATIDLAYALRLLSLPRDVGVDPETGKTVTAGLGRFGPYVQLNRVFASVNSVDTLFAITLEEALERIRNKNRKPVLKELGPHPETGVNLQVLKGRYGPYVTDGKLNATLGKNADPEELTIETALELLRAAAERKPAGKKVKKKATKKKSTKKKTTKKKTTKKKSTKKPVSAKSPPAGK